MFTIPPPKDPLLHVSWLIVLAVLWLFILSLLTGCDVTDSGDQLIDAYKSSVPENVSGTYRCTNLVKDPKLVDEVDSLSSWPYSDSGTYRAMLVRTTWVSTNKYCSIWETGGKIAVVGGLKGITRYFGKWKTAPANPNYRPPVQCVDCDWPK